MPGELTAAEQARTVVVQLVVAVVLSFVARQLHLTAATQSEQLSEGTSSDTQDQSTQV